MQNNSKKKFLIERLHLWWSVLQCTFLFYATHCFTIHKEGFHCSKLLQDGVVVRKKQKNKIERTEMAKKSLYSNFIKVWLSSLNSFYFCACVCFDLTLNSFSFCACICSDLTCNSFYFCACVYFDLILNHSISVLASTLI